MFTMTPEDFINGPDQNHPEVASNPEAMKRAEQVTLRHLLHVITDKARYGYERDGRQGVDLHRPGEFTGVATVYRIEKGTSSDNPNRVGQIHRGELVGDNGDKVITNWFILDTPDGLQIEKHSQTSNQNEMLGNKATLEDIYHSAVSGIAKIAELQKAHSAEDELGLSFVSEQEARELLIFLDPLEPTQRHTA